MKKVCIVCAFLLAAVGIYYVSYAASVNYFKSDSDIYERNIPTQEVDANKEIIVSNVTQFIEEEYNSDTKEITEKKINTPIEYIGLTRNQLIKKMTEYMIEPTVTDKAKGLVAFQLVEFSQNKVTVRKSYSTANVPMIYYICVEKEYLKIYLEDKKTLYDNTSIKLSNLPESVQRQVIKGLKIEGVNDLYDFLETYTS